MSAAGVFSELYWEYVLPLAYHTFSEPKLRVARITASIEPPVTIALVALLGIAAVVCVASAFGHLRKSAQRARTALGWFAAHTLAVLTAMVVSSPLRTEEEMLAAGIIRTRDAYLSSYAAGLCLWQAWAGAAFTLVVVVTLPRSWRRAGVVSALRLLAASLLFVAPFSFAWFVGDWDQWIVLAALPCWVSAELHATTTTSARMKGQQQAADLASP